jgi:hypothetical protein
MLELLLFDEKLEVMNYLYSLTNITNGTFEWFSKEYFEKNSIVTNNNDTFFIMYKLDKRNVMKLNRTNKWTHAEPEDERELFEYLNKLVKDNSKNPNKTYEVEQAKDIVNFDITRYNKHVGFIGYGKNNKFLAFKTKDMTSKRDTGARCDEATKNKNLTKLNQIVGEEKYTTENTKAEKDANGNVIKEAIGNDELCVLEEFILRFFDVTERGNKKWFLTPEMALIHNFYKIFV